MDKLDTILQKVIQLKDDIAVAIASAKLNPKQITILQGVSDINNSLGSMRAGEFLALSNGEDPQDASGTGTFISALGRIFGSKTYHIGGVKDGDLKWGANAETGELEAGDGAVNMSTDGIAIYNGTTEVGRFGNLNGFLDYSTDIYGMAMGDSNQYMKYDQINGLQVSGAYNDGWTKSFDTFTYVSSNLVTVDGDQTDIYEVGCRWKFKQGAGWKYMYMISATYDAVDDETDIVVDAGNEFTVTNAAITDVFYSYQSRPNGFPSPFEYTPVWGLYYALDAAEAQPTLGPNGTLTGYYELNGNRVTGRIYMAHTGAGGTEGGPDGAYYWTLPLDWDRATNSIAYSPLGPSISLMQYKEDYASSNYAPTTDFMIIMGISTGAIANPTSSDWTSYNGWLRAMFDYWIAE